MIKIRNTFVVVVVVVYDDGDRKFLTKLNINLFVGCVKKSLAAHKFDLAIFFS